MGPVDLRIGYEGEFNSDITSHAANFKIVLPLGGRAAPPPPPPAPSLRRRRRLPVGGGTAAAAATAAASGRARRTRPVSLEPGGRI